jgi:hypothetical protein
MSFFNLKSDARFRIKRIGIITQQDNIGSRRLGCILVYWSFSSEAGKDTNHSIGNTDIDDLLPQLNRFIRPGRI